MSALTGHQDDVVTCICTDALVIPVLIKKASKPRSLGQSREFFFYFLADLGVKHPLSLSPHSAVLPLSDGPCTKKVDDNSVDVWGSPLPGER